MQRALIAVTSLLIGCGAHQLHYAAIGTPPIPRAGPCHVEVMSMPEPGMTTIGVIRCSDGSTDHLADFSKGPDCLTLALQKACEAGGDAVFGAHVEQPSGDFVADVGKLSEQSVAERLMTRTSAGK